MAMKKRNSRAQGEGRREAIVMYGRRKSSNLGVWQDGAQARLFMGESEASKPKPLDLLALFRSTPLQLTVCSLPKISNASNKGQSREEKKKRKPRESYATSFSFYFLNSLHTYHVAFAHRDCRAAIIHTRGCFGLHACTL